MVWTTDGRAANDRLFFADQLLDEAVRHRMRTVDPPFSCWLDDFGLSLVAPYFTVYLIIDNMSYIVRYACL